MVEQDSIRAGLDRQKTRETLFLGLAAVALMCAALVFLPPLERLPICSRALRILLAAILNQGTRVSRRTHQDRITAIPKVAEKAVNWLGGDLNAVSPNTCA